MAKYDFPFVNNETPRIRAKIVSDLDKMVDWIKQDFLNATIVLSGSFSYGEGSAREEGDKIVNQSDYDIYVILKSPIQVIFALTNKGLKNINSRLGLEDDFSIDLTVIWEGLLHLGLTAISGKVIYGNPEVGRLIDRKPISRKKLQISQLKAAYLMLIEGLTEKEPEGLQNALIQGFRSFLGLKETKTEIHEFWKNYFSLRHNLGMLYKYRDELRPDMSELIRSALMSKLEPAKIRFEFTPKSIALTKEILSGLFFRTKRTFLWTDYLQYIIRQTQNRKVPRLYIDPNKVMLRASYHLSNAIGENGDINQYALGNAKKILQSVSTEKCVGEDRACFAWYKEKIRTLGSVYLHKVRQKALH